MTIDAQLSRQSQEPFALAEKFLSPHARNRAFVGALIMPRTIGKDPNQQHPCAALGTRRTSDYPWPIANIRTPFFLPTLDLAERDRLDFWMHYDYSSVHLFLQNVVVQRCEERSILRRSLAVGSPGGLR
jgi:hypothetical protein